MCGSSASARPKSTISSSNSSSSQVGRGPRRRRSGCRRKNVEQIRQSLCGRDRVAEQLRPPLAEAAGDLVVAADTTAAARPASSGECASVHFMFVMRPPVAACAAASAREASGAPSEIDRADAGHPGIIAKAPVVVRDCAPCRAASPRSTCSRPSPTSATRSPWCSTPTGSATTRCSASRTGRTCRRRRSCCRRSPRRRTTGCGSSRPAASCRSPGIRRSGRATRGWRRAGSRMATT